VKTLRAIEIYKKMKLVTNTPVSFQTITHLTKLEDCKLEDFLRKFCKPRKQNERICC